MEQTEAKEQPVNQAGDMNAPPAIGSFPASRTETALSSQAGGGTCATCGGATGPTMPSYVYAAGRVDPRFPNLSAEKEFNQVVAQYSQEETKGKNRQELLYFILSKPENRYLVRQMCWVLIIGGVETYILLPRDPADFALLVEAINPALDPMNHFDVVIGVRGGIAPPEMCNGLMVPIAAFDKMYSFDREVFINAVPLPDILKDREREFREAVRELFDRIMQMSDNAGATDEHRALNYLAVRYPAIYAKIAEQHLGNSSLTTLEVRPSPLSGVRKIVEVIFSYIDRQTGVIRKFFTRVDVTEEFPFLVTMLSDYYDR